MADAKISALTELAATPDGADELAIVDGGVTTKRISVTNLLASKMANPMTTGADIIYGGASGVATRLANGTDGQVLTSTGTTTAPAWEDAGGGADFNVFIEPGDGFTSGTTLGVSNAVVGRAYHPSLTFPSAGTSQWTSSIKVPVGATGIASIKVYYFGDTTNNYFLKFYTSILTNAPSGSASTDDTTDTDATYAGAANSNTWYSITIPAAAYNALSITENYILSINMYRNGDSGSDNAPDMTVLGMEVIFN